MQCPSDKKYPSSHKVQTSEEPDFASQLAQNMLEHCKQFPSL